MYFIYFNPHPKQALYLWSRVHPVYLHTCSCYNPTHRSPHSYTYSVHYVLQQVKCVLTLIMRMRRVNELAEHLIRTGTALISAGAAISANLVQDKLISTQAGHDCEHVLAQRTHKHQNTHTRECARRTQDTRSLLSSSTNYDLLRMFNFPN